MALPRSSSAGAVARVLEASEPIDATNLALIDALIQAPRATHRELAARLGANEVTIASRLRRLVDAGVVTTTLAFDWHAVGYRSSVYLWITCHERPLTDIADDIAALHGVQNIVVVLGPADLFVQALLPAGDDALLQLRSTVSAIKGVVIEEMATVLKHYAHRTDVTTLPITEPALPPMPNPVVDLDELDHGLCEALAADARQSNREIARTLGTSERTIRARLKRLEDAGLLRIVAMVDARALPSTAVRAYVGIRTEGDVDEIAEALRSLPSVSGLTATTGNADLGLLVVASTADELVELLLTHVRTVPGVRSTVTHLLGRTIRFSTRLRRFV